MRPWLVEAERAAAILELRTVPVGVRSPDELPQAFVAMTDAQVGGLVVLGDAMLRVNRKTVVGLAATHRLPAIYGPQDYAEDGGLLAYGVSIASNFRRSAAFIDKIFRGANAADLPVEEATKLNLTINLRTARTLGLTIPADLLTLADAVIE